MYDLAVLGAGIVGTMTAHLAAAAHPAWRIVLVDRATPGCGATAYSLAVDVGSASSEAARRLVARGAPVTRELAGSMPQNFHVLPALAVVPAADAAEWRSRFSAPDVRAGHAADLHGLRARRPELVLSAEDTVLGGLTATAARPVAVVESMVVKLRLRGVAVWEGTEALWLDCAPEGVVLTMADGRGLRAARVVVAVGPWITTGFWKPFADRLEVRVKKVVAMHLDLKPRPGDPLVLLMADDAFLLPDLEGDRYLFSFASQEWDVLPDASSLRITQEDRRLALEILERRAPALAGRCSGGRVFCDAYARDRVPFAAGLEVDPRACVVTGSSGSGFRLAPGMAMTALDHLASLETPATAGQAWR